MAEITFTAVTDEMDLNPLASLALKCIQDDKLSKLKTMLMSTTKEQRSRIVNSKIDGNTLLFTSCQQGKLHFVKFLLDDCNADIELKGVYKVEEDQSRFEVSPLWCASVDNHLDIVKILIEHGANVNMPSDTDSTPVRSACFMTNISVIKYLVEHGADLNKPNVYGGTCLINAIKSAELCSFLISKGVDVNAEDNTKNTALHYAIREGVVESVQLLLNKGADFRIQNDIGDDGLQTAALRGNKEIVDVIINSANLGDPETIRAYELLGAYMVDEKNEIVSALIEWRVAMELRHKNKNKPILKELPLETKAVYCHAKEPQTLEEFERLSDPEQIEMQALLIRERILGLYHKDTTFGLMYTGAVYADSYKYQRCVDLWKYAYTLRYQPAEPLNHESVDTIQYLVKVFWEFQVEVESGASEEKVIVQDAIDVLDVLTEQIIAAIGCLKSSKPKPDDPDTPKASDLQLLMQLYLHMIHLLTRLDWCSEEEKNAYLGMVNRLVATDPRCCNNLSLLHLAMDPNISMIADEYYSSMPSLGVVIVLVRCKADVNVRSGDGNSPLHIAAKYDSPSSFLAQEKVIGYLLEKGAHIDVTNNDGVTPLDLMSKNSNISDPLKYMSLKWLATIVIMTGNIYDVFPVPVSKSRENKCGEFYVFYV